MIFFEITFFLLFIRVGMMDRFFGVVPMIAIVAFVVVGTFAFRAFMAPPTPPQADQPSEAYSEYNQGYQSGSEQGNENEPLYRPKEPHSQDEQPQAYYPQQMPPMEHHLRTNQFALPPARAARYQSVARNEKLLLGLRPEHITEAKPHPEPGIEAFDTVLDVTEPMGMETLIYFTLEGAQICGRVNPNAGARDGGPLRLAVDLNNMHLLNEVTGVVI